MNKISIATALIFGLTFIGSALAKEKPVPVSLSLPTNLIAEACKTPAWNGLSIVWNGVSDKRGELAVGVQTQKGEEPIPVVSEPPLDQLFDGVLKELFATCGMKFVDKGDDTLNLSVEIREFYAGVEKKLITGKSQAKSGIAFLARHGNQSQSVTVGYEIESKKIKSGNIKQLTKTINELFAGTIRQIPATQEMRQLK